MGRQCTSWVVRWGYRLVCLALAMGVVGCTSDPIDDVPWGPEVSGSWYALTLAGHLLGVEERVVDDDGALWRRRWQRFEVAGTRADLVVAERWHPDGTGGPTRGGEPLRGHPFDVFGGPAGRGLVRLPYGQVVAAEVVRHGHDVALWWEGPEAGARFDDEGLVSAYLGALVWTRVAERPADWEPVDVQRLLAVSVASVERARRRRVGRYRVGGEPVRVDTPLDAELPRIPLGPRAAADAAVDAFVERAATDSDVVGSLRALAAAVAAEVDFAPTLGAADGAAVLSGGRGDCTEHTALFLDAVAALGLEARPVAGLVYLDEGVVGPGLYPHAWAEVLVGERWVAADPTFGTFPADAARVPLHARIDVAMDRRAQGLAVEVVEVR